jgi:hypothetical protein
MRALLDMANRLRRIPEWCKHNEPESTVCNEAKKLLSEANSYLQRPKVRLVLLGLSIAPRATSKVASIVERIRD